MSATDLNPQVPQTYTFDGSTTDAYQYLFCPGCNVVNIQIGNNSVLINFGVGASGPGSGIYPPRDESYLPITGSLMRTCDVIRFKSRIPGKPALLLLTARP